MWDLFFASVLVEVLFLYVPGFALVRSLCISRIISLVYAPVVSIALYSVLSIAYSKMGFFCSWVSFAAPVALLSFVVLILSRRAIGLPKAKIGAKKEGSGSEKWVARYFDTMCLVVYVGVGLILATLFLLGNMDDPGSFSQEYDNVYHLGLVHSYLESGDWSPLSSSLYMKNEDVAINPLPGSGFYPSAWSILAALPASALGVPIAVSANALNFLFVAVVFPSSMFLLMRGIFRDQKTVIPFGALCALGFVAFPWGLLVFGPLYPNMIAFSIMPAVVFCFMELFFVKITGTSRIALIVLFALGLLGLMFTQPNALFTAGVFLAPFCIWQATVISGQHVASGWHRSMAKIVAGTGVFGCIMAIWLVVYTSPFMEGIVNHWWPSFEPFGSSFFDALSLSFRSDFAQATLAALVVIGGVYTLFDRRHFWILCSYVVACAMYMIDASSDGPIKFLFTGFWYTDSNRVAAFASIFAIPLASIGLWLTTRFLKTAIGALASFFKLKRRTFNFAAGVVAILFLWSNYYPLGFTDSTSSGRGYAFGALEDRLEELYSNSSIGIYDAEEKVFVQRVKHLVPEDSLIINVPDDGSAFAYGVDSIRVYYRNLRTYGGAEETETSKAIRNSLDKFASDVRVRRAVEDIGADYVLMLDHGPSQSVRKYLFTYEDGRNWRGIESIEDDTPGFEIVLMEEDMRLYKIKKT